MKLKNNFFYTIREDVRDEESTSGKLLVRSGMIKKIVMVFICIHHLDLKLYRILKIFFVMK